MAFDYKRALAHEKEHEIQTTLSWLDSNIFASFQEAQTDSKGTMVHIDTAYIRKDSDDTADILIYGGYQHKHHSAAKTSWFSTYLRFAPSSTYWNRTRCLPFTDLYGLYEELTIVEPFPITDAVANVIVVEPFSSYSFEAATFEDDWPDDPFEGDAKVRTLSCLALPARSRPAGDAFANGLSHLLRLMGAQERHF